MPSRIRSNCPDCGKVDIPSSEVKLVRRADFSCNYDFRCPECQRMVIWPASEEIQQKLITGGVQVLGTPLRLPEDQALAQLPPLTPDDLIDAHQLSKNDRAFDQELDKWVLSQVKK